MWFHIHEGSENEMNKNQNRNTYTENRDGCQVQGVECERINRSTNRQSQGWKAQHRDDSQ